LEDEAVNCDIALITIGRNAGEGSDRKVENDFNLKANEMKLISDVSNAFHAKNKKVVVIINAGGVIETASWRNKVDAILLSWQPGMEAGNAVADILSGKVNPSGKLATTFPIKYGDDITAKNFPGKEFKDQATTGRFNMPLIPAEVIYEEGIYVGYRYYNSFKVKPAYEFGYGLSYTNYDYGKLTLGSTSFNGNITALITITNKGKVAGQEVVQLYLSAPSAKLNKPSEELKAFAKTKLLQPGESQQISFTLLPRDLTSFDTERSAWIADAGKYMIKIGASSTNILQTASFDLGKEIVVEKTTKSLAPSVKIDELKK
jgi:beta-glucosidase